MTEKKPRILRAFYTTIVGPGEYILAASPDSRLPATNAVIDALGGDAPLAEGDTIIVYDEDSDDDGKFGYLLFEGQVTRDIFQGKSMLSVATFYGSRKFLYPDEFKLFLSGNIRWEDIPRDI